eukprot:ANDGO_00791.mRNA.1 WD repeat-containing protein 65
MAEAEKHVEKQTIGLTSHHLIGFRKSASGSVHFLSDDSFTYVSGRYGCIYEDDTRTVTLMNGSSKNIRTGSIAVSANGQRIALLEIPEFSVAHAHYHSTVASTSTSSSSSPPPPPPLSGAATFSGAVMDAETPQQIRSSGSDGISGSQEAPMIRVYSKIKELKRVRALPIPSGYYRIPEMCFSKDGNFLYALCTSQTETCMATWQLDRAKLVHQELVPADQCRISVRKSGAETEILTSGQQISCLWRATMDGLKQFPLTSSSQIAGRIVSHSFFGEDLVVIGIDSGKSVVYRGTECVGTFVIPPESGTVARLSCLKAYARGLIVATEMGFVHVFELSAESTFVRYKSFWIPSKEAVLSVDYSPSQEWMSCVTEHSNVYRFPLSNVDLLQEDSSSFRLLPFNLHSGAISDISAATQKPLLITISSQERGMRIYDFVNRKIEVTRQFSFEEPVCCAIHPLGYLAIVGFPTKIVIFNVLISDAVPFHEIPIRNPRMIKFSNGGQSFGVSCANSIYVFSTLTLAWIHHFRGHSGTVKSFCWDPNDSRMVSVGFEGAVYEWNLAANKRSDDENYTKGCEYLDVVCQTGKDGSFTSAICSGSDGRIKLIEKGVIKTQLQLPRDLEVRKMKWLSAGQTLIAGTSKGTLRLYSLPFDLSQPAGEDMDEAPVYAAIHYAELPVDVSAVTSLALSFDEQYLFVGTADACFYTFDVTVMQGSRPLPRKLFDYKIFSKVAMIDMESMEEKTAQISQLTEEIDRRESDHNMKLKTTIESFQKELREVVDRAVREKEDLQQHLDDVNLERVTQVSRLEKELQSTHKSSASTIEDMVQAYERKLRDANAKLNEAKEEKDDLRVAFEDRIEALQKRQQEELENVQLEARYQTNVVEDQKSQLEQELEAVKDEYNEILRQERTEYESQAEETALKVQSLEQSKAENATTIKAQSLISKRKADALKDEIGKVSAEKDAKEVQINLLKVTIKDLQTKNSLLAEEVETRDQVIVSKEKRIMELKKQTTELEKLRYVLSYKFQELKKEIGPKEEQVQELANRIREMDDELERLGIDKEALKQSIDLKTSKVETLLKDISCFRAVAEERRKAFEHLKERIAECLMSYEDPRVILKKVKQLVEDSVNLVAQKRQEEAQERNALFEAERQRSFVAGKLDQLSTLVEKNKSRSSSDLQKRLNENAALLKEVNDLRHEKHDLNNKITQLQTQLHNTQSQLRLAENHSSPPSSVSASIFPPASSTGSRPQSSSRVSSSAGTVFGGLRTMAGTPETTFEQSRPNTSSSQRLVRGSNIRALKDGGYVLDKLRIAEMLKVMEMNNLEITRQREEIDMLRAQLSGVTSSAMAEYEESVRVAPATPGKKKSVLNS